MRKLLLAGATGAALLGGAMVVHGAAAQPYGAYRAAPAIEPGYRFDAYGRPYFEDRSAPYSYASVPYDSFGPDPNGMFAADGHRLKCKLDDSYDGELGRYIVRRVCE